MVISIQDLLRKNMELYLQVLDQLLFQEVEVRTAI